MTLTRADRVEAAWQIADRISEYISESREYRERQFPRCPGAEFRRVTV